MTNTTLYKSLKALKVPDSEIEKAMLDSGYEVDFPKVFVYTPDELRGQKERWKHGQKQVVKQYKATEVAA